MNQVILHNNVKIFQACGARAQAKVKTKKQQHLQLVLDEERGMIIYHSPESCAKHNARPLEKTQVPWSPQICKFRGEKRQCFAWFDCPLDIIIRVITLHKAASGDPCTSQVSPLYLCRWKWKRQSQGALRHKILYWSIRGQTWSMKWHRSHLWTSLSPLLFVICHVNPLFGSKPGWEISKPCFFTNFMYLECQ